MNLLYLCIKIVLRENIFVCKVYNCIIFKKTFRSSNSRRNIQLLLLNIILYDYEVLCKCIRFIFT